MGRHIVELPDGQRIIMEADTPEAAVAGADEWYASRNRSAAGAIETSASDLLQGLGESASQFIPGMGTDNALKRKAQKAAPENYDPALTNERSLAKNPGYIPRALLESSLGPATDLTAGASLSPLGPLGYLLGSTASYTARTAGNTAKEIAQNERNMTPGLWRPWYMRALGIGDDVAPKETFGPPDPNAPPAEPTAFQKARAVGQSIGEGMLASLGPGIALGKFAKPLAETGVKGIFNAAKRFMVGTGVGAGTAAGTDVLHDVGVGNEINPTKTENAAVLGGSAAALLGGRRAAKEGIAAHKFREITPELRPAASEVANALESGKSFRTTKQGIASDISAIASDNPDIKGAIKSNLDAVDALRRARSVEDRVSPQDIDTLSNAVKGTVNEASFIDAVKRMRAAEILESKGDITKSGDLVGGLSHKMGSLLRSKLSVAGASAGLALLGAGTLPLAMSGKALGVLGAAGAGAYGLDRILGLRDPAARFREKFADGGATRLAPGPVPQPTRFQPQANATGPKLPLIQPWAARSATVPPVAPTPPAAPPTLPPNLPPNLLPPWMQPRPSPAPAPQAPTPAPTPSQSPQGAAPLNSVVDIGGVKHEIIRSPLPPTPTAVIEKITKSKGKTEVKQAAPQPVEAPKPAPKPTVVRPADDGLDIPEFLRRDTQNKLAQVKSQPEVSTKPRAVDLSEAPASDAAEAPTSTIDDLVTQIADRRASKEGFTHGRDRYEAGVRTRLLAREKIAKKLSDATGIPFAELRAKAFDTRKGQFDILANELKARFKYDPAMNAKIDKASRGHSKGW